MVTDKGIAPPGAIPIPFFHDNDKNVDVYPALEGKYQHDVLVPCYGNVQLTIECLNALYANTRTPFHLLIMHGEKADDYGMTDVYIKNLHRIKGNITYVHYDTNWPSGNYFFNVGIKYARTEYLTMCMNSITVEPDWEITALQLMNTDPKVGIIGFKCLFPNGLIESAGIAMAGHIPIDIGRDDPGYRRNNIMEVPAVQWAFCMTRKNAIEGNLDDKLWKPHVGWDDIDDSFTVRSKGWKILYCGMGAGIHKPRASRGSNSADAQILNKQNAVTFWKRWGLFNKYLEASAMDVAHVLKHETKDVLTQQIRKIQMLQQLRQEAENQMKPLVDKAIEELGVKPGQYLLEMNPDLNVWLLKVNAEAVEDEGGFKELAVKPASDTEAKAEILEKTIQEVVA